MVECKKKILLQFPEGLKQYAQRYADDLSSKGYYVFLSSKPSYGACDLAYAEAEAIGADKIVHFGHSEFPFNPFKERYKHIEVEYVPWRESLKENVFDAFASAVKSLGISPVGLITTIQFSNAMEKFSEALKSMGIDVFVEKGTLAIEPGQILGCDPSAAVNEVKKGAKAIIYIGGGSFHPMALTMVDLDVRIFSFNPKTKTLKEITKDIERYKKKRKASVIAAFDAKSFGILVSIKNGQFHINLALDIKKKLESVGRKAYIIVGDELSPIVLLNYTFIDAFITTACPRIVDDEEAYNKPILDVNMFNQLLSLIKSSSDQ